MPMEIRLYGGLKRHLDSRGESKGSPGIIEKRTDDLEDVHDILNDLNISEDEISHIFVNGDYSNPSKNVKDGDRVAIFPKNMGLLYKWYFRKSGGP